MKSTNKLHGSHARVPQLPEVDVVDHEHCHEVQISHEVGVMWGIKTISMKITNKLHGSRSQVPQLPEVDLVNLRTLP